MMKLHTKDMKILRELDFDARQPVSQIARKVGLSPEVTAYRIKQLEKKGIITGYYPVIDLSKLGYMFCRNILQLEKMTPEIESKFFEYLEENKSTGWLLIADNWRVIIVGYAKTIQEAKNIAEDITLKFNPLIKEKYLSIATKIHHFRHKYLYNEVDEDVLYWGEGESVAELDAIDKKILLMLTKNARAPATELAQQVGLTSVAVMNRMKRMQKEGVIQGYRCALDLKKLGYTHVKIFLYADNLTKNRKNSLIEFIHRWLYSVYITEAYGKADLEFECHIPNMYLLEEFMKKMREKFPEIRNYENILHYKEVIRRYVPEGF